MLIAIEGNSRIAGRLDEVARLKFKVQIDFELKRIIAAQIQFEIFQNLSVKLSKKVE
jgi:hypothetical protein